MSAERAWRRREPLRLTYEAWPAPHGGGPLGRGQQREGSTRGEAASCASASRERGGSGGRERLVLRAGEGLWCSLMFSTGKVLYAVLCLVRARACMHSCVQYGARSCMQSCVQYGERSCMTSCIQCGARSLYASVGEFLILYFHSEKNYIVLGRRISSRLDSSFAYWNLTPKGVL